MLIHWNQDIGLELTRGLNAACQAAFAGYQHLEEINREIGRQGPHSSFCRTTCLQEDTQAKSRPASLASAPMATKTGSVSRCDRNRHSPHQAGIGQGLYSSGQSSDLGSAGLLLDSAPPPPLPPSMSHCGQQPTSQDQPHRKESRGGKWGGRT